MSAGYTQKISKSNNDDRISLNNHVNDACKKSVKPTNGIARIMPNVSGPRSSMRRLPASVSSSIMLYGVSAWGAALKTMQNRDMLYRTFRLIAVRVASAFRTISVCNIAEMMHICITLVEDIERYNRRNAKKIVRIDLMTRPRLHQEASSKDRTHVIVMPGVREHREDTGAGSLRMSKVYSGNGVMNRGRAPAMELSVGGSKIGIGDGVDRNETPPVAGRRRTNEPESPK
ncbi:uncharacterized protein LOC131680776 [Topomyia yanbarensis]|uniref:uncharacterized protein LOC131680776 n=1 Tax=Topomyia yanbarensis TaxID=2498891 RepID=UPI00273C0851|nr:uncharacterized protein LOC131680776 [Topomyia yanbarensis]